MSRSSSSDPVTDDVRARFEPHLRNLERLAHESLAAGNFAGAAGYFRNVALACEHAAEEQNRGWILAAGRAQ